MPMNGKPDRLQTAQGAAPSYAARAWVNFNGTGTPAIRRSGNVTSITDLGVGSYQVNFTVAMADTDYAPITCLTPEVGSTAGGRVSQAEYGSLAVGSVGVYTSDTSAKVDMPVVSVVVFR